MEGSDTRVRFGVMLKSTGLENWAGKGDERRLSGKAWVGDDRELKGYGDGSFCVFF